jgi:hypothetical protein
MRGALLAAALLACVMGCRSPSQPPALNLAEPGWTVRHGEAVWRRERGGGGIAGELLAASRADGQAFVQFSKGSFPLIVAQSSPRGWMAKFPLARGQQHSGRGRPPTRIIFLQLPRVLAGLPPPKHWTWQSLPGDGWRLENGNSGESLEVYWDQ